VLQELLHHAQMTAPRGTNERSGANEASSAAIRPAIEKNRYDLFMTFLSCLVKSCNIDIIAGIDVCPPFKHQPDHARMPVYSGHHKRRAIQLPGSRLH
jgi:hypothetical protein